MKCLIFTDTRFYHERRLNYADIFYFIPLNESFQKKIELVQYNAAFIITGAVKGVVVIKFIKN